MAVEPEIVDGRAFTAQVNDLDLGGGLLVRGRGRGRGGKLTLGSGKPWLYCDLG